MSNLKLKIINKDIKHYVNKNGCLYIGNNKTFVISEYERNGEILRLIIEIETITPEEYEGTLEIEIQEEKLNENLWTITDSPEFMELGYMVPSWESYDEIKQKEIDDKNIWIEDEECVEIPYILKIENSYSQICTMVKRLSGNQLSKNDKERILKALKEISEKQKELMIKKVGYSILKYETDTKKIKKILDQLLVEQIHEN